MLSSRQQGLWSSDWTRKKALRTCPPPPFTKVPDQTMYLHSGRLCSLVAIIEGGDTV